jgi:hypothetical protein
MTSSSITFDGVGVEDELARLADGERRRDAGRHDQRRVRLLSAHEGARRAALGDQGHAHGPIVTFASATSPTEAMAPAKSGKQHGAAMRRIELQRSRCRQEKPVDVSWK